MAASFPVPAPVAGVEAGKDLLQVRFRYADTVITHSQASAMRVRLTKQDDAMRLSVDLLLRR